MEERDVQYLTVSTVTQSSSALSMNSFLPIEIPLVQDFDLERIARGIETITLSASFTDYTGSLVDPSTDVTLQIYDVLGAIVSSTLEGSTETGVFSTTYTPPASGILGVYRAVHSATVAGSGISATEYFKVVPTYPGSYFGQYLRGEDTFKGSVVFTDTVGNPVDPLNNNVVVTVKSSTGVQLISVAATRDNLGEYSYSYSPGYNDPVGTYQIKFTGSVNGSDQEKEQFIEVVARKGELLIDGQTFRDSTFGRRVDLTDLENEQIEDSIADAQAIIENYLGYRIFSHIITGERQQVNIDTFGRLALRLNAKPIVKLIKVVIRYHPTQSLQTLLLDGFEIDQVNGMIYYVYSAGYPIDGTVDMVLRESSFDPSYDVIIDYEVGINNHSRDLLTAVKILTAGIISGEVASTSSNNVKSIKSGNYQESYFDNGAGDVDISGYTAVERRAFEILKRGGYTFPGIV